MFEKTKKYLNRQKVENSVDSEKSSLLISPTETEESISAPAIGVKLWVKKYFDIIYQEELRVIFTNSVDNEIANDQRQNKLPGGPGGGGGGGGIHFP
jgi:hypothetical protein